MEKETTRNMFCKICISLLISSTGGSITARPSRTDQVCRSGPETLLFFFPLKNGKSSGMWQKQWNSLWQKQWNSLWKKTVEFTVPPPKKKRNKRRKIKGGIHLPTNFVSAKYTLSRPLSSLLFFPCVCVCVCVCVLYSPWSLII